MNVLLCAYSEIKKEKINKKRREGDIIITTGAFGNAQNDIAPDEIDEIDNMQVPNADYSDMESNHTEGRLKDRELIKEINALDMMETVPGRDDEFIIPGDDDRNRNHILTPRGDDDNKQNVNQFEDDTDDEIDNIISPQFDEHDPNDNINSDDDVLTAGFIQ